MNKPYLKIKEASFVTGGALLGLVFARYDTDQSLSAPYLVVTSILLLLIGLGLFDWITSLLFWLVRLMNKRAGYFSIYAPYEVLDDNSSWVGIKVKDICKILEGQGIKSRISKSNHCFKEYPIILNPYGGVYPEENVSNLTSLENIFNYVKSGGVYINIADIPFYYAYDNSLKRSVDTTPLADGYTLERPFLKTMLTQKLNHYVWGIASGEDLQKGIARVIQLTSKSKNLFSRSSFIDGPQGGYTPVIQIPYGKGFFIFSTLQINTENSRNNITRITVPALEVSK